MARATSKTDLVAASKKQFDKLQNLIDSMSLEQQNAIFSSDMESAGKESHWKRDKNLRDVLIHLYEWHCLLLNWVKSNQNGEKRPFLPAPYNWRTYPEMNVKFWEKHQTTALQEAKDMLLKSHQDVMSILEGLSDEDLFTKKKYDWTGTSHLGAYFVSATSSHYDWAMKKIKLHIKNLS